MGAAAGAFFSWAAADQAAARGESQLCAVNFCAVRPKDVQIKQAAGQGLILDIRSEAF